MENSIELLHIIRNVMYSMTSNALLTKTSHPLNHGKVNKTAQLCVAGDAVEI